MPGAGSVWSFLRGRCCGGRRALAPTLPRGGCTEGKRRCRGARFARARRGRGIRRGCPGGEKPGTPGCPPPFQSESFPSSREPVWTRAHTPSHQTQAPAGWGCASRSRAETRVQRPAVARVTTTVTPSSSTATTNTSTAAAVPLLLLPLLLLLMLLQILWLLLLLVLLLPPPPPPY